jgi:hypothetical protein
LITSGSTKEEVDNAYIKYSNWVYQEEEINVYPNSYTMNLNHPTDCIDLCLKKYDTLKQAKIILRIDGETYTEHEFNDQSINLRIKCKNLPNKTFRKGAQNCLLSESINQNTINFSRVDRVELILTNCECISAHQYRYMCYAYPSRALRYDN